jgi:soluble lytic murein transglycosylase-like protein
MDSVSEARFNSVSSIAAAYGLDTALVCALVEQESNWNPWAVRYEPAFFDHYIRPLLNNGTVKTMTEATCRAISWGLMQVMGQVAREMEFIGPFLSELCDTDKGLDMGCRVLKLKLDAAGGDTHNGLQLYNGGGDPNYAAEVMARMSKYQ